MLRPEIAGPLMGLALLSLGPPALRLWRGHVARRNGA
jgi:hypothetical protein